MRYNPSPHSYRQSLVAMPRVAQARLNPATLKRGSTGNDVKLLQEKLSERGYGICESHAYLPITSCDWEDGTFDSITDMAVREFQKAKGLGVDGIVGRNTWAALGVENSVVAQAKQAVDELFSPSVPGQAPPGPAVEPFYKKTWFIPAAISGAVLLVGTFIIFKSRIFKGRT